MNKEPTSKPTIRRKKAISKPSGRKKGVLLQEFKWAGQYKDFFHQKMVPISEAFIDRLSQDLATWAINDDEAYKITQFILKKGIPPDTFYDWINQFPVLNAANKIAVEAIGNRREMGGLKKQLDSSIVQFTMPSYDKNWKELRAWSAKLKEQENKNDSKIVIIERYGVEPNQVEQRETKPTPEEVALEARPASMRKTITDKA